MLVPKHRALTDPELDKVSIPDVIIGMDVLRHLHVYFAAKEKRLYITDAVSGESALFHYKEWCRRLDGPDPLRHRKVMPKPRDPQKILEAVIDAARRQGADAADALLVENVSASVSYRLGNLEDVERSESADLGLRVFVGNRVAMISSSDFSADSLAALPERAIAMARLAPEDRFAGLAPRGPPGQSHSGPGPGRQGRAHRRKFWSSAPVLPNRRAWRFQASPIPKAAAPVSRAWASRLPPAKVFSAAMPAPATISAWRCWRAKAPAWSAIMTMPAPAMPTDLPSAEAIGKSAGEKAVRRLDPRKVKSQNVPVVFDPREAGGLLGHFAGAISGASVARGTSFLKDRMGTEIFAPHVR